MSHPPITIAVDAMGGDHAPRCEVAGALQACVDPGIAVLLVGNEELLRDELNCHPDPGSSLRVIHASQVISMKEGVASSLRQKRDSSIHVAARLVREGRAQGMVSAGNTGVVMATSKIVMGTLPSVDRPALAAVFPALGGRRTVMIDVGANVDCSAEQLRQFAVMGEIYSRIMLNVTEPRVGLLSIGAEPGKGNELTKQAYRLLRQTPLRFIGNVEGRDLYNGSVDVIVCDGFIGNVALKISEGLGEWIAKLLQSSPEPGTASMLQEISRSIDYSETGGAPLLGVKGVCTICHGRSNANAIKNAIRMTAEFISAGINEKIEAELRLLTMPRGRRDRLLQRSRP